MWFKPRSYRKGRFSSAHNMKVAEDECPYPRNSVDWDHWMEATRERIEQIELANQQNAYRYGGGGITTMI